MVPIHKPLDACLSLMMTKNSAFLLVKEEDKTAINILTLEDIEQTRKSFGFPLEQLRAAQAISHIRTSKSLYLKIEDDLLQYAPDFNSHFPYGVYVEDFEAKIVGVVTHTRLINFLLRKERASALLFNIKSALVAYLENAYRTAEEVRQAMQGIVSQESILPIEFEELELKQLVLLIKQNWIAFIDVFYPLSQPNWEILFNNAVEAKRRVFSSDVPVESSDFESIERCMAVLTIRLPARTKVSFTQESIKEKTIEEILISRFEILLQHLNTQKNTHQAVPIDLDSFKQVFYIDLPEPAFVDVHWWSAESEFTNHWLKNGWRISSIDFQEHQALFEPII